MTSTSTTLPHPAQINVTANVLLGILAVYWIVLLSFAVKGAGGTALGIELLLIFSCCYLLLLAILHSRALSAAVRVLAQHRVPDTLWQQWRRAALRQLLRYGAIVCAGMLVLALLPASPLNCLAMTALLSLVFATGIARSLSSRGLLPSACGYAIDTAVALAAIEIALRDYPDTMLARFAALPVPLLLALAASWPALLFLLSRRWQRMPTPQAGRRWLLLRGLACAAMRYLKRYSPVPWTDAWSEWRGRDYVRSYELDAPKRSNLSQAFTGVPIIYMYIMIWSPIQWNRQLKPVHLAMVLAMCLFMGTSLMVRDLHWRSLLVPGGLHRGRIATHIFLSTMSLHLIMITASAMLLAAISIFTGEAPLAMLAKLLSYSAVLPELALAMSVALVLRGLPHPGWVQFGTVVVAIFGAAYLSYLHVFDHLALWNAGPRYMAALALATLALLTIANRLWTPKKLFPFGIA